MKRISGIGLLLTALLFADGAVIKDNKRGLMWEESYHSADVKVDFAEAKRYCRDLNLSGFQDWRVPTLFELLSIVDFTRAKPAIKAPFKQVKKDGSYWTVTPYVRESEERWVVSFKDGATSNAAENYDRYVRCVRTMH